MPENRDHQLMLAVRDGDLDQLGHLFEKYHKQLYGYFMRQLSNSQLCEDIVQEVFFRMLKYRHTYRGDGQFRTWMYSIACNVKTDHFRSVRRRPETTANEVDAFISPNPNPEESFEKSKQRELLDQALEQLSEQKREVLILRRFQNLKYKEIAEVLNCPVGTVKARLFHAIKDVKMFVSKQGVEITP